MYTNQREAYRQAFFQTWQKYQAQQELDGIEKEIIQAILMHPEYHELLSKPNHYEQQEFAPEDNPFLHLSLHLSLQEQLRLNRPVGIKLIYEELLVKENDPHLVLHKMMTCLAQIMWEAQQTGEIPEEKVYLEKLKSACLGKEE